ncbi:pentatricopeptide repeat protein [Moniliophthora roreri MCA 2997]|nr:pentatricopeptide repeat protein [Moniliophthora roreri MCA 2997]KAI3621209.1 pentatricopeptide repeat protein [Moniliophthora roreri]
MLPKVATTILHSTGRAAAAVHTQSHTIRNVLHPSSSKGTTGTGHGYFNSNNNNGSRGGRFTHGYHGASRAVTQANPSLAVDDGSYVQIEEEEPTLAPLPQKRSFHPQRRKFRSESLSQATQELRLDVLRSVQRIRKHPFEVEGATRSTSTTASQHEDPLTTMKPPLPLLLVDSLSPTEPQAPQSVSPPQPPQKKSPLDDVFRDLHDAATSYDKEHVSQVVFSFLTQLSAPQTLLTAPTVREFESAILALYNTRTKGEPLTLFHQTYDALLAQGLLPNQGICLVMIQALMERDEELDFALGTLESKKRWQDTIDFFMPADSSPFIDVRPRQDMNSRRVALEKELHSTLSKALNLFQILSTSSTEPLSEKTLKSLLRSCALHVNVTGALQVWQVAGPMLTISPTSLASMYGYLIETFSRAGHFVECCEVFDNYRRDQMAQTSPDDSIVVFNSMISAYFRCGSPDKAVDLLHEMLTSESTSVPRPAISTYTNVISGFCIGDAPSIHWSPPRITSISTSPSASKSVDIATALLWFNRLLEQPLSAYRKGTFRPLKGGIPTRPDHVSWKLMLETLAKEIVADPLKEIEGVSLLDTLNNLFVKLVEVSEQDSIPVMSIQRMQVVRANLARVNTLLAAEDNERAKHYLDFLRHVIGADIGPGPSRPIWEAYFKLGEMATGIDFALAVYDREQAPQTFLIQFAHQVFAKAETVPLKQAFAILDTWAKFGLTKRNSLQIGLLDSYASERTKENAKETLKALSLEQWTTLVDYAATHELGNPDRCVSVAQVLSNMTWCSPNFTLADFSAELRGIIVQCFLVKEGPRDFVAAMPDGAMKRGLSEELDKALASLPSAANEVVSEGSLSGSDVEEVSTAPTSPIQASEVYPASTSAVEAASLEQQAQYTSLPPPPQNIEFPHIPQNIRIDRNFTRQLDEYIGKRVAHSANPSPFADSVFNTFSKPLFSRQISPSPYTLSKLAWLFGRAKQLDKLLFTYAVGQRLLEGMENDKKGQSESWLVIENGMCIAFASMGEMDKANVHRLRMLEQGGAPSADAYAGLILGVRDTTDDTSNAVSLFKEAIEHGVKPNLYLFNNVISKLAKARKASAALELFHSMKQQSPPIAPSAITYGAVIGACARVGDVVSAEVLFREMTCQWNFKPRVPPFNTMMQLYTTTKPDREKTLWYFNEMRRLGVAPTEHTYKLLMEAYALDPIDLPALLQTFEELQASPNLKVFSTHYATLINAFGCILKDLDRALETFTSIPPQNLDALAFEALVNVLVAHRRMDLVPSYITLMNERGVHMTAYICNGLIKGYSSVGDIDKARDIFEGMGDPPVGRAGLYNHALRGERDELETGELQVPRALVGEGVNPMAPVHREPSTWEAMVRAELGAGHRERAMALVERMQTRQYPEAVVNRVRGIMVDHSQVLL